MKSSRYRALIVTSFAIQACGSSDRGDATIAANQNLTDEGARWTRQPSGVVVNLNAIGGTASEIYAVGDRGVILHSTGDGHWALEDSHHPDRRMTAVSSEGIVGGEGIILEKSVADGTWRDYGAYDTSTAPSAIAGTSAALGSIWTTNLDPHACYCSNRNTYTNGLWRTGSATFAVGWPYGGSQKNSILVKRDGGWTPDQEVGTQSWLYSIWGTSETDLYAVGWKDGGVTQDKTGLVLHRGADGKWAEQPTDGTYRWFTHVYGAGANEIYAFDRMSNTVFASTGNGVWNPVPMTGISDAPIALWVAGPGDVYLVGYHGSIYHMNSSADR